MTWTDENAVLLFKVSLIVLLGVVAWFVTGLVQMKLRRRKKNG